MGLFHLLCEQQYYDLENTTVVKMFAQKPLNLDSKSPRAARQPRFFQICHHTSSGTMNYESISTVLNHNIQQVGGHMAANADLFFDIIWLLRNIYYCS